MEDYRTILARVWGSDGDDSSQALKWIQEAVTYRREETLYLDFKQKSVPRDGLPSDDDKANLAKAISGFANTDGGLLVWGVKAKPATKEDPDVATDLCPISGLKTFVTRLNSLAGELTAPPVAGIENRSVPNPNADDQGYVVTIVPKKRDALVQAAAKTCKGYYIRTGSGFYALPPSMIAEFYSRRPSPLLRLDVSVAPKEVREHLTSAGHWKQTNPRSDQKEPWGSCSYDQELVLEWSAVLRNTGLATARDVEFRLRVERRTWEISDVDYKLLPIRGGHPRSPGLSVSLPATPDTAFRQASGSEDVGGLHRPLHPGQEAVVARGELVTSPESLDDESWASRNETVRVSGQVFCLDIASTEVSAETTREGVLACFRVAAEALKPRTRELPEPSGYLDSDNQ